ncbi:hypothetical protein ACIGO9_31560 [Nocardia asteroides]|uniref:hypothetical protein n=1 Tax=Nocardia asteroides TaxID=1824 RepID=UPI0037CC6F14
MTDEGQPAPAPGTADLDAALDRIRRWIQAALERDTLIPSPAAEPHAEDQLPVLAQLAALFIRAETALPTLLPNHDLLTAARSEEVRVMWLDIGADQRARFPEFAATFNPEVESRRPAGSPSELFQGTPRLRRLRHQAYGTSLPFAQTGIRNTGSFRAVEVWCDVPADIVAERAVDRLGRVMLAEAGRSCTGQSQQMLTAFPPFARSQLGT